MDHLLAENKFRAEAATAPGKDLLDDPIFLQRPEQQLQPGTYSYKATQSFHSPLEKKHNLVIKRFFDISFSIVLMLCLLSWMIPLFAILIKLDSRGPVFFRQRRNRNGGSLFTCIKFRTMIVNEEADLVAACRNDARITAVGKFLRHYHLDELPQLLNVLCGHMSVIGPRPYMVAENIYYENLLQSYSYRHSVKPGITGLAQSFGYVGSYHDLQKVKERVDLDILYIRKWSLQMDAKILYRTFMSLFGINFQDELKNL